MKRYYTTRDGTIWARGRSGRYYYGVSKRKQNEALIALGLIGVAVWIAVKEREAFERGAPKAA